MGTKKELYTTPKFHDSSPKYLPFDLLLVLFSSFISPWLFPCRMQMVKYNTHPPLTNLLVSSSSSYVTARQYACPTAAMGAGSTLPFVVGGVVVENIKSCNNYSAVSSYPNGYPKRITLTITL